MNRDSSDSARSVGGRPVGEQAGGGRSDRGQAGGGRSDRGRSDGGQAGGGHAEGRRAGSRSTGAAGRRGGAHRRFGWTTLFLYLLFGYTLEVFHGFKSASYLLEPIRREMWTLAHFHGALLALLNLVYVRWADAPAVSSGARRGASRALLAGSLMLPLGFFLGGLRTHEGDPGIGIALVPLGALLLLYAVGRQALGAWRRE